MNKLRINDGDKIVIKTQDSIVKDEPCCVCSILKKYTYMVDSLSKHYNKNFSNVEFDDLRQEAYIGLYNAIITYSPNKNSLFSTYASLCISNKIKNSLLKSCTNKELFNRKLTSLYDYSIAQQTNIEFYPEFSLIQKENYNEIIKKIKSNLSEIESKVFFSHLHGLDYLSIALKLACTTKSVDNALQRAKRKLQLILSKTN